MAQEKLWADESGKLSRQDQTARVQENKAQHWEYGRQAFWATSVHDAQAYQSEEEDRKLVLA